MRYESARHDSPAMPFESMDAALRHLEGSRCDSTRPYLRVLAEPDHISGSFLVIGGRKLSKDHPSPPPSLCTSDQSLLDAWRFVPPEIKHLLDEIDRCDSGYVVVDSLDAASRSALAEALLAGHAQLGAGPANSRVVHRPGQVMGAIAVEKIAPMLDSSNDETAIHERQQRWSLCG